MIRLKRTHEDHGFFECFSLVSKQNGKCQKGGVGSANNLLRSSVALLEAAWRSFSDLTVHSGVVVCKQTPYDIYDEGLVLQEPES